MEKLKSLLLLPIVFTFGCSVAFNNKGSPIRYDQCKLWAPVTDSVLTAGAASATYMVFDQNIPKESDEKFIAMGMGMMGVIFFALSTYSGYMEYAECKGALPIFGEENGNFGATY